MKKLFFILPCLFLFGCSKGGDDRLAEQADIQAREQYQAQNENQKMWAEKMEDDLNKRKRFIQAIEGEYLGQVDVQDISFDISARFVSSIPIEFPSRVRTLDEINFELQNLNLNLFVKLENPRVSNSAVTCVVEGYRPDVSKGVVNLITESCKNSFHLSISDSLKNVSDGQRLADSRSLAAQVTSGSISRVDNIQGVFESSTSSQKYKFQLRR
ncbi:MAG: hypothetical protein CME64_00835 [Halobacteriovoraceae bacterium]|nr:hypothetical protein [Halobacteriovoraceae bacterium]MBG59467.1 hypothetical protein [Peredibacter sp.]MBI99761.1 hypothetical protein [Halobacteriovoraceae bacterium]|tara:strand:- start:3697 stop:4335 length:639 start_codon:yes stop_codon:yes gene_type:complete